MIVVHQNALIITFSDSVDKDFANNVNQLFVAALDAMIHSDCDYRAELFTLTQLIGSALDTGQFDEDVRKNSIGKCMSVIEMLNLAPTFAPLVQPSI